MVSFALLYFVIHYATQNLNFGPVMQSHGHQSMSVGTALFTLWFPVLVFHNVIGCFARPGLVFGGQSASPALKAALLS